MSLCCTVMSSQLSFPFLATTALTKGVLWGFYDFDVFDDEYDDDV